MAKPEDKTPAKKDDKAETALVKRADSPYAVIRAPDEEWGEIIRLNLQGAKVSTFDLDRLRVPDGKSDFWTVPTLDGSESEKELNGIVVMFGDMRGWWSESDPSGKPPECGSDDGVTGIGKRWDGDEEARHDCASCKYAQFGSDPKGGRGQWCKQTRAVFMLRSDTFLPLVLFLPPTSLKPVQKFFLRLGSYGQAFNGVETSFSLVKDKNDDGQAYNKVEPRVARKLSPDEKAVISAYTRMIAPSLAKVQFSQEDLDGSASKAGTGGGQTSASA